MITDPIADMLTRIRNANQALHVKVEMPNSGMRREIARILEQEGYIEGYQVAKGEVHDTLVVTLKYGANRDKVLGGMGVAILSTSTGVVTGRQAQEKGVGGEVLCYVW
jgi:small subunit ribosomal protein S8